MKLQFFEALVVLNLEESNQVIDSMYTSLPYLARTREAFHLKVVDYLIKTLLEPTYVLNISTYIDKLTQQFIADTDITQIWRNEVERNNEFMPKVRYQLYSLFEQLIAEISRDIDLNNISRVSILRKVDHGVLLKLYYRIQD